MLPPCRVCRLQLCAVYLKLAPKYLLEMFKYFVVLCEDFKSIGKKVDGKVVWDDKQRPWLVARMKKKANFTNKVTDQPVEEWDVSALCAALVAVLRPSEVVDKVKKVKDLRNDILHGQEVSRDGLKAHVEDVRSLIDLVKPMIPDQPWDEYLKELDNAEDSELCCDHRGQGTLVV